MATKAFKFNSKKYLSDLQQAIRKVANEVSQDVYQRALTKARSLPMKSNQVNLANGKETSDLKRRFSLLQSITKEKVNWMAGSFEREAVKYVVGAVGLPGDYSFKEDHIGLYYEFGTGKEELPFSLHQNYGDANPFRNSALGSPIVTRSKYKATNGDDSDKWEDVGGNIRVTKSPRGGDPENTSYKTKDGDVKHFSASQMMKIRDGFVKYVGDDVKAYQWFREAFKESSENTLSKFDRAFMNVNPLDPKYWVVRDFTLGRRM